MSVRIVTGEPVKVEEVTDVFDRVVEGSDVVAIRATDTEGNSALGMAHDREQAENRAIYNLGSSRNKD